MFVAKMFVSSMMGSMVKFVGKSGKSVNVEMLFESSLQLLAIVHSVAAIDAQDSSHIIANLMYCNNVNRRPRDNVDLFILSPGYRTALSCYSDCMVFMI